MTFPAEALSLSGSRNTRELGGCPTSTGIFPYGRFMRSDLPEKLTEEELLLFQNMSLCCVIDLRSEWETKTQPCALKNIPNVTYINVPLSDHIHSDAVSSQFPNSMGEMYIGLLENHSAFQKIFQAILNCPNGLILFHCKAGKDRTGILSMLLLKLSGADDEQIVADYLKSDEYLEWRTAKLQLEQQLQVEIPEYMFRAEEKNIRQALSYFTERYSSAEGYLKELGFSEAEIKSLICRVQDL